MVQFSIDKGTKVKEKKMVNKTNPLRTSIKWVLLIASKKSLHGKGKTTTQMVKSYKPRLHNFKIY